MIIRGTLEDMEYIFRCMNENTDLKVVYQRSSQSELYITDEKE